MPHVCFFMNGKEELSDSQCIAEGGKVVLARPAKTHARGRGVKVPRASSQPSAANGFYVLDVGGRRGETRKVKYVSYWPSQTSRKHGRALHDVGIFSSPEIITTYVAYVTN